MYISEMPIVMLRSLIITIIIEVIIAIIIGYRNKDLVYVLLVNILTNPLLNSLTIGINYYYGLRLRNISVIIFEIIVLIVEGLIYQKYLERKKIKGLFLSLILNLSSYGIGLIINRIIY